jgi:multidrug efflux pump subunit AcrB
VVSRQIGLSSDRAEAIEELGSTSFTVPNSPPELPPSWQAAHFTDASDIWELRTLTRSLGVIINTFLSTGKIVGALGQTDDLTPDDITQMIAIDPTIVQYFKAEHLASMSPEVFSALPDDFIAGLDGFTRDELAAKALAQSVTGIEASPDPVDLPNAWRISPPQLISFSFDDIPLASFSVFGSGNTIPTTTSSENRPPSEDIAAVETTPEPDPASENPAVPEGPALPPIFALLGAQLGLEINTADDLINITLPESFAQQFGTTSLRAADLLNFIVLLGTPDQLPTGMTASPIPINPQLILGNLSPEAIQFLVDNDASFLPNLQSGVFDYFSDSVLALPDVAPPLAPVWDTLAQQPQLSGQELRTASDLLSLGNGAASAVLNQINSSIPPRFAGYEVRLFDSLSTGTIRYLEIHESDFLQKLSPQVLLKLSPAVLNLIPTAVIDSLDPVIAETVQAIANGQQESAAQQLATLYVSSIPDADPNAPVLNAEWTTIGNFIGAELDSADDLFRFFPDAAEFINSFFDSAQGAAFAPNLLGNLPTDAFDYMAQRDPTFVNKLRIEALQLLPAVIVRTLPQDIQDMIVSGGEPFKPTSTVTRTNGNSSLLLVVYKASGANTVEAFHAVEAALKKIDEANPLVSTTTGFEQASFIEESINGVLKEGGLGGLFAVVIILLFLSKGSWSRAPRRIAGLVLFAVSLIGLGLITANEISSVGGDVATAFSAIDSVVRLVLMLGIIAGLVIYLWPGTLPYPAWRSTLVVGVSIPLSLLMALTLMYWLPPTVNSALSPAAESSPLLAFFLRLFPASITINIMTLSGLTVAIGRVVDDSIVVLENIFRQIHEGGDKRQAIITGTRDVSVAIFAATIITVVVFLPLGLTGGIISEFFLPFGLAVTYALMSSFVVAITVVPLLAFLFISVKEAADEGAEHGYFERVYLPVLRWSLHGKVNQIVVLGIALISLVVGGILFGTRPRTFIPSLGEPQISVNVNLPAGTKILDTNAKVFAIEEFIRTVNTDGELGTVQSIVGGGGASLQSLLGVGGGISENVASITIGVENQQNLDRWTQRIRAEAERIFGKDNVVVSAATISDQGFGGFEVVLAGPEEDLRAANQLVINTLNSIPGITNATSDLDLAGETSTDSPSTFIRIDGRTAVSFSAELETEDTLGVTQQAISKIRQLEDLPASITVSQGFDSELQTQGFQSLFVAMAIAIVIVIAVLIITFGSVVHWFDIILSIVVAPVGAAVLLTLTDRVLGISAMIGLLMLIGIVVTNAVVLIDRVQANRRERYMNVHDALIEAGGRRLRPILMTALATIFALMPLAFGLSKGAIIAAELGTVVIGGLVSSTLLTLIVVPVMYSLVAPIHKRVMGMLGQPE